MEENLKNKILENLSEFEVRPDVDHVPEGMDINTYRDLVNNFTDRIVIQKRLQRDGNVLWVVLARGNVLSKSEKWFVYDGMNSDRTQEHLQDTRFNSIEEALKAFQELNLYRSLF